MKEEMFCLLCVGTPTDKCYAEHKDWIETMQSCIDGVTPID